MALGTLSDPRERAALEVAADTAPGSRYTMVLTRSQAAFGLADSSKVEQNPLPQRP
jgi:hypothetical protein